MLVQFATSAFGGPRGAQGAAGAQGAQGAAGAGASLPFSRYIDPINGNDTTGTGLAAAPWKTIQKAFDSSGGLATALFIYGGNAGSLVMTQAWDVIIYAIGPITGNYPQIENIATRAFQLQLTDAYGEIIRIGSIDSASLAGDADAGTLIFCGIGHSCEIFLSGGANFNTGGAGPNAGSGDFRRCNLGTIHGAGGSGGNGDSEIPAGNGGNGATVFAQFSTLGGVNLVRGFPGGDGGAGGGTEGLDGTLTTRLCQIYQVENIGTDNRHATIMDNGESTSWID